MHNTQDYLGNIEIELETAQEFELENDNNGNYRTMGLGNTFVCC